MLSYRSNVTPPPVFKRVVEEVEVVSRPFDPKRKKDYIRIEPLSTNPFRDTTTMIQEVARSVAADFGIRSSELMGPSREMRLVHPRCVARKLLVEAGLGTADVGRRLCASDHSSVIHALKMFPIYAKTNPLVQEVYDKHRVMLEEVQAGRLVDVTGDS